MWHKTPVFAALSCHQLIFLCKQYTIKEEVFTPEQLEQLEERGIHLTEQETQREYRVSVIEDPSAGRFVRQTILAWNGN